MCALWERSSVALVETGLECLSPLWPKMFDFSQVLHARKKVNTLMDGYTQAGV